MCASRLSTSYPSTCGPDCWLKQVQHVDIPEKRYHQLKAQEASLSHREECAQKLYQPIQSWQTRVLNIKAGNLTDPLTCDLVVADIVAHEGIGVDVWSKVVPYEALSYSWGYPSFTTTVRCNGIDMPVTMHLATALRHLRYPKEDRRLWTDAFCVNQYDKLEKSQQVQNMFLIFQKAFQVIVWLGDLNTKDSLVLGVLSKLPMTDLSTRSHDKVCFDSHAALSISVESLLKRQWFRRTWVRQEVFAARKMEVVCGPIQLSFSRLVSGLQVIRSVTSVPPNEMGPYTQYLCFDILAKSRSHGDQNGRSFVQSSLSRAVSKHRETSLWLETLLAGTVFEVSLGKDRVYGIMGMVEANLHLLRERLLPDQDEGRDDNNTASNAKLRVDYNRSDSQVFQDTVKYLVNSGRNLTVLTIFQSRQAHLIPSPSWSLRLDNDFKRWYCRPTQLNFEHELHDFGPEPPQQDLNQDGVLRLRGRYFGVVGEQYYAPRDESYFAEGVKSVIPWNRLFEMEDGTPNLRLVFDDVDYSRKHVILAATSDQTGSNRTRWRNWVDTYVFVADTVTQGDELVLCDGSPYPFALRRIPQESSGADPDIYAFLGPAPLVAFDGLHYGKAVSRSELDQYMQNTVSREFLLV